ncbi:MAG: hypothetical protein K2L72_04965 [Clostridia bacterium]|nr:hypothetical protein [Clostridia bacterium]
MEFFAIADIIETAFVYDVYKKYYWAVLAVAGCCFAVLYVFKSIALYAVACRGGFKNKWMAFVPFFNTYYIGVVSDKNNVFRAKAKYVSLAAALVELVFSALSVVVIISKFIIFKGGYAAPEYGTIVYFGTTFETLNGYTPVNLPVELNWAWWFAMNALSYLLYWIELMFVVLNVFVLVAFFRTYSPSRYVLFAILSVLFPLSGVFMFAVRNNPAKNYVDYLREQQQRQYRMYQEYMRGNMNGMNMNGMNGQYYGGYQGDPYAGQQRNTPPEDPFGGLGSNGGGSEGKGGDPFDEFKN